MQNYRPGQNSFFQEIQLAYVHASLMLPGYSYFRLRTVHLVFRVFYCCVYIIISNG